MITRREQKAFDQLISGELSELQDTERFDIAIYSTGGSYFTIDNVSRSDVNGLYEAFNTKKKKKGLLTVTGNPNCEVMIDWSHITFIRVVDHEED
jgi:hypothetical protein